MGDPMDNVGISLLYQDRPSDSPYVELVTHGFTVGNGTTVRPSEINWHLVFARYEGKMQPLFVGPLTSSGVVTFSEGIELLWIKFKLGTFMPHLPTRDFLDVETELPGASSQKFWLKGSSWQFPDYENADTFVERLVRDEIVMHDPLVHAALQDQLPIVPPRTLRHRFLRATGLTQSHIRQFERAQQASALLQQGTSILDTVFELGYTDQSHLTHSLKRYIGTTPARERITACQPEQVAISYKTDSPIQAMMSEV
jgi:AraC-like DNA-binding protein